MKQTYSTQRSFESGNYSVVITEGDGNWHATLSVKQSRVNWTALAGRQSDMETTFIKFTSREAFNEMLAVLSAASEGK